MRLRYGVVPYSSTVNVGALIRAANPAYLADSVDLSVAGRELQHAELELERERPYCEYYTSTAPYHTTTYGSSTSIPVGNCTNFITESDLLRLHLHADRPRRRRPGAGDDAGAATFPNDGTAIRASNGAGAARPTRAAPTRAAGASAPTPTTTYRLHLYRRHLPGGDLRHQPVQDGQSVESPTWTRPTMAATPMTAMSTPGATMRSSSPRPAANASQRRPGTAASRSARPDPR